MTTVLALKRNFGVYLPLKYITLKCSFRVYLAFATPVTKVRRSKSFGCDVLISCVGFEVKFNAFSGRV